MFVDTKEARQLGGLEQECGGHADQKRHPPAATEQVTKVGTQRYGQQHIEVRFVSRARLERRPPGAAIGP